MVRHVPSSTLFWPLIDRFFRPERGDVMSSRTKKNRIRAGNLFVPQIFSFGAALEEMSIEEFLDDPTKISNTLRMIQNFFQVDGVFCYADSTVLAEALGCNISKHSYPPTVRPLSDDVENLNAKMGGLTQGGRIATVLEVTKRLNILLPECVIVGLVTGPLTLAGQLSGRKGSAVFEYSDLLGSASKASLIFSKALGETGIDVLMMYEKSFPLLDDNSAKAIAKLYAPIWNTAKFYDIKSLLMVEEFLPENMPLLRRVTEGLVFPLELTSDSWQKVRKPSLSLPFSLLEKEPNEIESFLKNFRVLNESESSNFFMLTTDSEVPASINKEFMIRGIQTIRDLLKRDA